MTRGHRLHRVRLWLSGLFAAAIIVIGVLIGLVQLALPWVASHPEKISALLSERLHRPVTIDRVGTQWERDGPLLSLSGLHLGASKPGAQPLTIASAGIKLNFFAWLRRNASWSEFRLAGIEVDLVREADGQWQLRGMDSGTDNDKQGFSLDDNPLLGLGTLVLRDARLNIDDVAHDRHFKLGADEARLINQGDQHRLVTRVKNLATASPPIDAVIEYSSADHSGRAYLGGKDLNLAAILRGYPLAGLVLDRGKGRGQFWAWIEHGELQRVRAEIDLADMVLETRTAIALDDKHSYSPHISFDRVAFGARWQRETDGWSADLADLVVERQGVGANTGAAHLRRSVGSDGNAPEYAASLSAIDIGAVTSTAMLIDTLPARLRRWLYAGNPDGSLSQATVRYVDAHNYDVAASFDALAWHSVDKLPGLDGFSGVLRGDQDALSLDLPQHNAVSISVPHVFRQALAFSELSGSIVAYRGDAAWRVETDALAYEGVNAGKTYGGELRGAVDIADDGARPTLDLYNLLTHADVPASHLFWPINIMPPGAVTWLDRALAGGRIVGGRAVFRGSLADWPFRNNAGRFEGVAEVEDFRLKYLADWPAVEHGHALTDFVNTGLHVDVDGGSALGNKINKASVDITDYGEGTLDINLNGQGGGRDLLAFIKATPLGTQFADPLQGVDVGGRAKVDFNLHAPMKPVESFTLDGKAKLEDADLSDAKYALHFDKANGPLSFNRSGFSADELATTFHDKPAKFSLAVGGYVANAQHVVEAKVETRLPVGTVLDYAPALSEYKKYTTGDANWTALFSVDQDVGASGGAGDSGQRLTLTSDLRGVRIDLPQPLAKSADSALPLKLTLTLPFIGADLNLRLGDILTMRGRLPALTSPFAANVQFG
ncbi:MAG: YhdP family protein, partial [Rudaea sp.]